MACYAAAVLLAAFAALVALPSQAEAQTEVWSGTLTVSDLGFSEPGCSNSVSGSHCSALLTDDDFTHDSTDYAVGIIFLRTNGQLEIEFDTDLTTATQGLTLNVDGTAFAFEDADSKRADARIWFSSGLSWSVGDTVMLTLIEPPDATLSDLVLEDNAGTEINLTPTFVTGTMRYTASVASSVSAITLTPTVNDASATVEYLNASNAAITDTDTATPALDAPLVVGANTFKVQVTAGNTTPATETYRVVVTRATDTTSPSPSLVRAEVLVAGNSVSVTFDEALDLATEFLPAAVVSAFTLTADGVELAIHTIGGSGSGVLAIRLPTGTVISQNQTVKLSYNKTTAGTDALEDAAANEVASFTDFAVTNNSTVVNSAPTFPSSTAARSVAENTAEGQNVGAVLTATDSDGDTLTYTLEGTDAASFALDTTTTAGSARIRTKMGVTYNHEAQSTYTVVVKADDGNGGTATVTVTITVTDVTEPPGQPAAPSVTTTSGSTTSLDVSWTAPANTGPDIDSYDLRYQKTTESTWTNGPQNQTGTSAAIGPGCRHGIPGAGARHQRRGRQRLVASGTGTTDAAGNTAATGNPEISGTAQVGMTLEAAPGDIADADGLTGVSYSYRWRRAEVDIPGATSSNYTLTSADYGQEIEVRANFTDDGGNAEQRISAATLPVAPAAAACPSDAATVWCTTLTVGHLLERTTVISAWSRRDTRPGPAARPTAASAAPPSGTSASTTRSRRCTAAAPRTCISRRRRTCPPTGPG